jgi:hypothetical protein
MSKQYQPQFQPTKTYEEYVEMFKNACEELCRTITYSEVDRHDFDLPTSTWFIKNCNKPDVNTYNDFLVSLGYESIKKHNKHNKYNYEIAFEKFKEKGLILLPQKYINCSTQMKYICPKHPDEIQTKSLNTLIFRNLGCYYCGIESRSGESSSSWKGGISPLNTYLRESITEWKKQSMENCDYKCVITGEKFDDIHHLYSFNKIVKEALNNCNLPIHKNVNDYTNEEMDLLKAELNKVQNKYPLGVCLSRDIHDLFHHLYGRVDNTPEQFEEFRKRYNNGEFNNININSKTGRHFKEFNVYKKEDNSFGMNFHTQKECSELLNIHVAGIRNCLKGRAKSIKGYLFYYIEEDPNLK